MEYPLTVYSACYFMKEGDVLILILMEYPLTIISYGTSYGV